MEQSNKQRYQRIKNCVCHETSQDNILKQYNPIYSFNLALFSCKSEIIFRATERVVYNKNC